MATRFVARRRHEQASAYQEYVRSCPTHRLLDVPVPVDYRLSPLGESPLTLMNAINDWARRHMADVDQAWAAYDARPALDARPEPVEAGVA